MSNRDTHDSDEFENVEPIPRPPPEPEVEPKAKPDPETNAEAKAKSEDAEKKFYEERLPATLGTFLSGAMDRADRRAAGIEKPIPLPWPSLSEQFGGGLWPGLHILVSGTGVGKTAWSLQVALETARQGFPVAYVGLELDEMQIALRLLGETANIPWSSLYIGKADEMERVKARAAIDQLAELPFHMEPGSPQGWAASELSHLAKAMRLKYPEPNGPGTKPMLIVVDFLQIIGAEQSSERREDLRERIGRASYIARHLARTQGIAVLVISSAARDKYGTLAGDIAEAHLVGKIEATPIPKSKKKGPPRVFDRKILRPDVLVGLGKESGEIEYSADSVTAAVKWNEESIDTSAGRTSVIFATAKGRATGAAWSELRFNGFRFAEPADGGAWLVTRLEELQKKNGKKKEEEKKKTPAEEAQDDDDDETLNHILRFR